MAPFFEKLQKFHPKLPFFTNPKEVFQVPIMGSTNSRRLLLSSVFKPFAVDDEFGVKENVCELMHNQVTRLQGVFSVRSHNRSFGLSFIAENLQVPTTVLDFPTQEEFVAEITRNRYSHIGISFIVPNVEKARRLCELARKHSPNSVIIAGGHGTRIPGIKEYIGCDEVCVGEGIVWLRRFFDEPVEAPFRHPVMRVDCYRQLLGVEVPHSKAILVPGVGCANKCYFCATSHFFDGYRPFFPTPESLFSEMEKIADGLDTRHFFVLDENFLDDPKRIGRLVELMEARSRPFVLDIFSSLRAISQYDPLLLVRLGVQFVWIGVESKRALFDKVKDIDASSVIGNLRRHGISVLASAILFLDHHDETTLWEDVHYTIGLRPDFTQFMQLAPLPGTALYQRLEAQGRIRHEIPWTGWHGQHKIWFRHPIFSPDDSRRILDEAFRMDFEILGPSLMRVAEPRLTGLRSITATFDRFLARRFSDMRIAALEMKPLLWAFITQAPNQTVRFRAKHLLKDYERELGPFSLRDRVEMGIVNLISRIASRRYKHGRAIRQPKTWVDRYRWT